MNSNEFTANYSKYIDEIAVVIKSNLRPVLKALKAKDPQEIKGSTSFSTEDQARGFVWGKFIEEVNKYSQKQITIDIKDIKNVNDMEKFFGLIYHNWIMYHPETSFHEYMKTDIYGNNTVPTFSDKEAKRLDKLNDKCWQIATANNVDIFELSMRIQELIWGEP